MIQTCPTDGVPLGDNFTFLFAFLMSFFFSWFGFLLAYCLCFSVAARTGAVAGLGACLVKISFYVQWLADHPPAPVGSGSGEEVVGWFDDDFNEDYRNHPVVPVPQGLFYVFLITGALVMFLGFFRFLQAKRIYARHASGF